MEQTNNHINIDNEDQMIEKLKNSVRSELNANQVIWELNLKLEKAYQREVEYIDQIERLVSECNHLRNEGREKRLRDAEQRVWELNKIIQTHVMERDYLAKRQMQPLYKVVAERVRFTIRKLRAKVKNKK